MLIPRAKALPGFIYEFKFTKDESADLDQLAETALKQIEKKKYDTELLNAGITTIGRSALPSEENSSREMRLTHSTLAV